MIVGNGSRLENDGGVRAGRGDVREGKRGGN